MKKILITGINGFLGSNLAKRLSADYVIIGLEYTVVNLFRLQNADYKVYSSKKDNLEDIFQENNIDVIIHTATIYRKVNEPIMELLQTNILMPLKLFELSQKYGVSFFINTDTFFNSSKVLYNYLGEYTLSKRHFLEWLKVLQSDTRIVNMKLFHMYGPGDSPTKFVTWIINELKANVNEIELTSGKQKRDFIFIDDVVNAFSLVIKNLANQKNPFKEFEVGTGDLYSIRDFVMKATQVIGSKSKLLFGALPTREGEIMGSAANNAELRNLGWISNVDLLDGINRTAFDNKGNLS